MARYNILYILKTMTIPTTHSYLKLGFLALLVALVTPVMADPANNVADESSVKAEHRKTQCRDKSLSHEKSVHDV